ncbi:MAG: hypothetical protein JNL82_10105 [Myxococcales bacterium]|nr:hypothetical protein [Myxococcales bacterium]
MTAAAEHWHDLRFHRDLYAGVAVDEAVQRYRQHIEFTLEEQPDAWVVRLRALRPELTRRVAHELANYALGLTVQRGGPG